MKRRQKILESVSKHILNEYGLGARSAVDATRIVSGVNRSNEVDSSGNDISAEVDAMMAQREKLFRDKMAAINAPSQAEKDLDGFRQQRDAENKARNDVLNGKTPIQNFPSSARIVGQNMSQLGRTRVDPNLGLPEIGGKSKVGLYGGTVYNPSRVNSVTAARAVINNENRRNAKDARDSARRAAQSSQSSGTNPGSTPPPPPSGTGGGSSPPPPPSSGTAPPKHEQVMVDGRMMDKNLADQVFAQRARDAAAAGNQNNGTSPSQSGSSPRPTTGIESLGDSGLDQRAREQKMRDEYLSGERKIPNFPGSVSTVRSY
jgi:hypothetical protein